MSWYSENPERFPAAVQRVTLPDGTFIGGRYHIRETLCVSGSELYYRAQDSASGEEVCLCEMLPLRWCMQDDNGSFVPYRKDAQMQWDLAKQTALARLDALRPESALPQITEIFEDRGTVWYAASLREERPLSSLLSERIIAPDQAVELLEPVMKVLAGLHADGLYHGNITASSVRLCGTSCELRDWNSAEVKPTAIADVKAVSRLLWQMMTGETEYRSISGASLPAVIRNALYNGMYDPDMTIDRLWNQLHAAKPAKRIKTKVASAAKPSFLRKAGSPLLTVIFCVLCLAVPLLIWHARIREAAVNSVPASAPKMPDVAYALSAGEIQVPELLYLTQEEAMQQLEELGLGVILARREDNPVVPEGCIVTQKPDAGTIVKAGDVVTLSLSGGWTNYVPDVRNMLLEDAVERLQALGFIVEYRKIVSPGDAPGTVIAQSVGVETKLERDSVIILTVSLGREDLDTSILEEVGNYVGMEFEEAKEMLSEIYLYAMQTETVYDPDIPAGIIISQDIPEGRKVPQGTIVNMKVSMGVETTRVPNVVLMNASAARDVLVAAGLKCILCYVSDTHVIDCVLSQSVREGSLVAVGTEVWLNVSVGSASHVVSTGGWSGGELPSFGTEENTEAPEETQPEETIPELPVFTDPIQPDPVPPPTAPPVEPTAPPVVHTDPPHVPEPTAPPPPVDPPPPVEDLTNPPMPDIFN